MTFRPRFNPTSLLSAQIDNIIYRHEIGMDSFGRMRTDSPIVRAHLGMLAIVAAVVVCYFVGGWRGVFYASGAAVAAIAVGTYPAAFRRAFLSLRRDRLSGALEQLYMTPLTHREIFEGMFFGGVAPFLEIRRYLFLFSFAFCFSAWRIWASFGFGSAWLLAPTLVLVAINHFGFSAYLGVSSGLLCGTRSARFSYSLTQDWKLNPWPHHLFYVCKYFLYILLPLWILFAMGGLAFYPAYFVLLLIPFNCAIQLQEYEMRQRTKIAHQFKNLFNFEATS